MKRIAIKKNEITGYKTQHCKYKNEQRQTQAENRVGIRCLRKVSQSCFKCDVGLLLWCNRDNQKYQDITKFKQICYVNSIIKKCFLLVASGVKLADS